MTAKLASRHFNVRNLFYYKFIVSNSKTHFFPRRNFSNGTKDVALQVIILKVNGFKVLPQDTSILDIQNNLTFL